MRHIHADINNTLDGSIDPVSSGGRVQADVRYAFAYPQSQHPLAEEQAGEVGGRNIALAEGISEVLRAREVTVRRVLSPVCSASTPAVMWCCYCTSS